MVWCAAVGCSNYKKKNRDLTFFNFPRGDLPEKQRSKENICQKLYICVKSILKTIAFINLWIYEIAYMQVSGLSIIYRTLFAVNFFREI